MPIIWSTKPKKNAREQADDRPTEHHHEGNADRRATRQFADAILRRLATRAMGLTGADIERIVREARLKARRGKREIRYQDIEEGIRGHRPPVPYNLRWRYAFHEAGHAVVHHALDLGPVRGLNIDTGEAVTISSASTPGNRYPRQVRKHAHHADGRASCRATVLKRVSSGSQAVTTVIWRGLLGSPLTWSAPLASDLNIRCSIARIAIRARCSTMIPNWPLVFMPAW